MIHIGGLGVTQAGRSGVSGSLRSSTLTPPSQGVSGNKDLLGRASVPSRALSRSA